jgi:hypothetical protein
VLPRRQLIHLDPRMVITGGWKISLPVSTDTDEISRFSQIRSTPARQFNRFQPCPFCKDRRAIGIDAFTHQLVFTETQGKGDMRKKLLRVVLACGACLGPCIANAMLLAQCGVERWSVKTGTDADAGSVNLASTTPTTIASLVALSAPQPIPLNNRVSPTETTVWTIDATLTSFKVRAIRTTTW